MRDVTTPATTDWRVTVVGEDRRTLTAEDVPESAWATRDVRVECSTGDRYDATWRGVPVGDALDGASPSPDTTHLVFESDSGYASCVPLGDAIGGVVAVERDGDPLADVEPYATRFVASGVDGARFVKGVTEVRAVTLEPGEDAEEYETLELDSPDYEKSEG